MSYFHALELRETLAQAILNEYPEMSEGEREHLDAAPSERARQALQGFYARQYRNGLFRGEPIYWSPEMSSMLESVAPSMPSWTLRGEALPSGEGFMYFATPLALQWPGFGGLRAIAFAPSRLVEGVELAFWVEMDPPAGMPGPVNATFWEFGLSSTARTALAADTAHDDGWLATPTEVDRASQYFAAALALMEQTVIVRQPERAPRATRKRLGEVGETPIHVVQLRRAERNASESDGEKAYELTCQFVVRGHWRKQFHPSDGSHRPKFILPYVKGPEGAPLRTTAERVFAVVR